MKKFTKTLFVVVAAAMVTSCSPPKIEVAVEKLGGRLRVTLTQDWGFLFFSRKRAPCIREAGLYVLETDKRNTAVWLIEAGGDVQCLDLATFTIGETPKGFVQGVALKIVRGKPYALRVGGIGWGEAIVTM